eukprot:TRINITY_DN5958_c0_g4_i1.p1 TRINITY_DN5958_c0_g4~~TRINITY_DN5958_c0_g4_i1.p1  ORF type:complete len:949 (-),score=200.25 TRINITY_DN5958_c0_g4_i1:445-3291(-)
MGSMRASNSKSDDITRQTSEKSGRQAFRSEDSVAMKLLASQKKGPSPLVICCRQIASSQIFQIATTVLTIYALVGDDTKLIVTEQPADKIFNYVTVCVIFVFLLEVFISSLGKAGYFGSFFMILDVVSTVTLLLDLDFVDELLQSASADEARSSRTARLGAKAGRVVRVLRLVRILKLYKAIYEARQAKKRREERGLEPGMEDEDDWDDLGVERKMDELQKESNVGRKLSELTIRKVIVLVLAMILMLPVFSVGEDTKYGSSAQYCMNVILDSYEQMMQVQNSGTATTAEVAASKTAYHNAFLQCIYYHNWYNGGLDECTSGQACSNEMVALPFWAGIIAQEGEKDILDAAYPTVAIPASAVTDFEAGFKDKDWRYSLGVLPASAKNAIASDWHICSGRDSGKSDHVSRGFSIIGTEIPDTVDYAVKCPVGLRAKERAAYIPERSIFTVGEKAKWDFVFWYDKRLLSESQAVLSLTMMVFICITLCTVSMFLSNDANRLVLHPVENMISKVETIRSNPLMAMKMADDEFKLEEMERAKAKREREQNDRWNKIWNLIMCQSGTQVKVEPMETVILEKTIIKLGSLLVLGFGEAGSSIIEQNMSGVDSACVDGMVEGTRVECIIGTTRINDFSIATEVLQAKVMTFVNQIAEIVHGVVDEFHGAANKNNGDTFLMIWRVTQGIEPAAVSRMADMSMLAFARILGAVHRSITLASYRGHPGLQQRLGKNCRVTLSSGLHYGWAIEGAVGSEFKIDASYLSPNVSIAETVERATHIYGVNILVAESVVTRCTADMASKCRLIDRVIITGSVEPMKLYAIDLDYYSLTVEPPMGKMNWNSRQRFKARQYLEAEKAEKWADDVQIVSFFKDNQDISAMRFRYTLEFLHVFNMGFQNYSLGEWQVAQRLLSRTRTMLGVQDGPSAALLRFMKSPYNFEAPENWTGIRELGMAMSG